MRSQGAFRRARALSLAAIFAVLVVCGAFSLWETYVAALRTASGDGDAAGLTTGREADSVTWRGHSAGRRSRAGGASTRPMVLFVAASSAEAVRLVLPFTEVRRRGVNGTGASMCVAGPRTREVQEMLSAFDVEADVSVRFSLSHSLGGGHEDPPGSASLAAAIASFERVLRRLRPQVVVVDGLGAVSGVVAIAAHYFGTSLVVSTQEDGVIAADSVDAVRGIRLPQQFVLSLAQCVVLRSSAQVPAALTGTARVFNIGDAAAEAKTRLRSVLGELLGPSTAGAKAGDRQWTIALARLLRTEQPSVRKILVTVRLLDTVPAGVANVTAYDCGVRNSLGALVRTNRRVLFLVVGRLPACDLFDGRRAAGGLEGIVHVPLFPGARAWLSLVVHSDVAITDSEYSRNHLAALGVKLVWLLGDRGLGDGAAVEAAMAAVRDAITEAMLAPESLPTAGTLPSHAFAEIVAAAASDAAATSPAAVLAHPGKPSPSARPSLLERLRQSMLDRRSAAAAEKRVEEPAALTEIAPSADTPSFDFPAEWADYVPVPKTNFVLPPLPTKVWRIPPASPDVSIVIPCYNGLPYVRTAIASLLLQTHANFEVIVVDDGSVDDSRAAIEEFSDTRVRLMKLRHVGLPAALNAGFRIARAPLFSWGSTDNIFLPRFVERMVALFREFPEAGFAYGQHGTIDGNDVILAGGGDVRAITPFEMLYYWPGLAAFMWRRAAHEAVGGFDGTLTGAEDWDFWLRIAERYPALPRTTETLYLYRLHKGQMSNELGRSGELQQVETRLAQKVLRRHGGALDPFLLLPHLKMCVSQRRGQAVAHFLLGYAAAFARPSLRAAFMVRDVFRGFFDRSLSADGSFHAAGICLAKALGLASEWDALDTFLKEFESTHGSDITTGERAMLNHLTNFAVLRQPTMFRVISCGSGPALIVNEELAAKECLLTEPYTHVISKKPLTAPSQARPYRLAVVLDRPLSAYLNRAVSGRAEVEFNPLGFFDIVTVIALDGREGDRQGLDDRIAYRPCASAALPAVLKELNAHVVRAFGGGSACDRAVQSKQAGSDVVCSVDVDDGGCCGTGVASADAVWPLTPLSVSAVLRPYGMNAEAVWRLSTRVDVGRFNISRAQVSETYAAAFNDRFPTKYRVLHVSGFTQESAVPLLPALGELGEEYGLISVGLNRTNARALVAAARERNCAERVFVVESVGEKELPYFLALVDVYTSADGTMSAEAFAAGLVVVAQSELGVLRERISGGVNGLLGNADYPVDMAMSLRKGVTDFGVRERLSAKARETAWLFHSPDSVDRWEVSLYRMAVERAIASQPRR